MLTFVLYLVSVLIFFGYYWWFNEKKKTLSANDPKTLVAMNHALNAWTASVIAGFTA